MNTKKRQKPYLTIRRYSFTLVETLIVLTIVALVASVVTINAKKAMRSMRFQQEVSQFVESLRVAQDLMLIANADVHVKIKAEESGIKYWIETDKPLLKALEAHLKKTKVFKTVHHVVHASGKEGLIDLKFLSNGFVMSSGNIQLSSVINNDPSSLLIANIFLKGFPSPIFSSQKVGSNEITDLKKETELIQMTFHEIQMIQSQSPPPKGGGLE